nr:MAG TPA: hypothetical protein [Microviridae sp.]
MVEKTILIKENSIKNSVPISKYHSESKVRQIEQKQQKNKGPSSKFN